MKGMAVSFWIAALVFLLRALAVVPSIVFGRVSSRPWAIAAGVIYVGYLARTVLAVRALPATDSEAARNGIWATGVAGLILAAMAISIR